MKELIELLASEVLPQPVRAVTEVLEQFYLQLAVEFLFWLLQIARSSKLSAEKHTMTCYPK